MMESVNQENSKDELYELVYWRAVEACLVRFHSYEKARAAEIVSEYWKAISKKLHQPEIVYNDEPFYVANDLASEELPVSEHHDPYQKLLKKLGYPVLQGREANPP